MDTSERSSVEPASSSPSTNSAFTVVPSEEPIASSSIFPSFLSTVFPRAPSFLDESFVSPCPSFRVESVSSSDWLVVFIEASLLLLVESPSEIFILLASTLDLPSLMIIFVSSVEEDASASLCCALFLLENDASTVVVESSDDMASLRWMRRLPRSMVVVMG